MRISVENQSGRLVATIDRRIVKPMSLLLGFVLANTSNIAQASLPPPPPPPVPSEQEENDSSNSTTQHEPPPLPPGYVENQPESTGDEVASEDDVPSKIQDNESEPVEKPERQLPVKIQTRTNEGQRSFGLFAAGKLGGAYRTLAQPSIDEPIAISTGHFMIAGIQLAWLPHLNHADKMLVRMGLDYRSSLNLKIEERYPDGKSSHKPIRHQWLTFSLAWMARRNKAKMTYAIGPALHYEIRMVYSEIQLVIPNYRVHVPMVSLPLLFSGAKQRLRFEISPHFAMPLADGNLDERYQPKMRMTVGGEAILFIRLFRRLGMTLNYRESFAFIGSASAYDHSVRLFSFGLAYDDSKLRVPSR